MYHLTAYGSMLDDAARLAAYTRALESAIRPGSVVLDLGTGIGTFALLAARLGAERVYAVDAGDVVSIAEDLARANGLADRITFFQTRASELQLPEKVDVIVSDLSGALPLFEEHIPALIGARDRFLAPGGVLIPARDRLLCAPVSNASLYDRIVRPWRALKDVDLGVAREMALNVAYPMDVAPEDLAAPPQCWAELDYATIASPNVSGQIEWTFETVAAAPAQGEAAGATGIHGIALWFECVFAEGIVNASGPWATRSVHSTILLPFREPLQVRERLGVSITATLAGGRYVTTWQASTEAGPRPRQSTFHSEPRSRQSLLGRAEAASAAEAEPRETFRVAGEVLSRPVGEEMLLFDPRSGLYHVLNETGARVWHGLERQENVERIAAAIAAEYDVDPRQAAADVGAVIARLQEANLIE
jgi:protein arginine N-methyltransferase 1